MGNFVGAPFDEAAARVAIEAKAEFASMVERWKAKWREEGTQGSLARKVLPFWMAHNVFESGEEFEANVVMILFAGTHNLENVLAHVVRLLLAHPEQLALVRADRSLLRSAVNETLRYCPAIRMLPRTALCDTVIPQTGETVRRGETVLLHVAAANRDPSVHEQPDEFSVRRPTAHKHLAFGAGVHRCNGSALGKSEITALVTHFLLDRFPQCALADATACHIDWQHTYSHLEHLYIRLAPN
eukprot:TRINITY_DN20885_c0_g1_i1.p1 TRINITY_DN20885_c0_g1~~TRINITY_DN20885_c0_g1_i1.p1  ORF type:complete len:270 (+),score=87.06 TRINITY_DN20885_c0_g1_i1:86-811(+)